VTLLRWADGALAEADLRPRASGPLRLRTSRSVRVERAGRSVDVREVEPGLVTFDAAEGATYHVAPR
jgi:hypothetical protein